MQGQKVSAGLSTVSLGGVSLVSYVLAVVAFVQGARDEATISLLAVGTVSLVSMAVGRFAQAIAKTKAAAVIAATAPPLYMPPTGPVVSLQPVPSTQGRGLDGEPGDDDALPDYATETSPPPDQGDRR